VGGGNPTRAASATWLRLCLISLVLGEILLRLALAAVLPRAIRDDEAAYLVIGRDLVTGRGFSELTWTPLYPLISGLAYRLVGDFEWASNLVYVVCGGLLLVSVFAIARRIYGPKTAVLSALLVALSPALNVSVLYWGTMSEPLYLCLLYGAVATFLKGSLDRAPAMFSISGALFGLAYLARPEAVVTFSIFLVGLVGLARRNRRLEQTSPMTEKGRWSRRRIAPWRRAGAAFMAAFVLLAAPYVLYLHHQTGRWMITGKLSLTGDAEEALAARDYVAYYHETNKIWNSPERFEHGLLSWAVAHPERFVRRILLNAYRLQEEFFSLNVFWFGLLVPVAAALFQAPWDRSRLAHEALLMTVVVPLLAFIALHIEMRFFAPAFPVLLIWTARGALNIGAWSHDTVARCWTRPTSRQVRTVLGWLPAAGIALLFVVIMIKLGWGERHYITFGYKEAGVWLRAHSPADAIVMTRSRPEIEIYADRDTISSRDVDATNLLAYARAHNATYFVVDEFELTRLNPTLSVLMDPATLPPGLELSFSVREPRYRTFVYHFRETGS